MRSDLNVSEQTRDRLRSQLDAKQREHGTLLSQVGFVYLCLVCWLSTVRVVSQGTARACPETCCVVIRLEK